MDHLPVPLILRGKLAVTFREGIDFFFPEETKKPWILFTKVGRFFLWARYMFKQKLCHLFRLMVLLANRDLHPWKTKMSGESPFLIGDTWTQLVGFFHCHVSFQGRKVWGDLKKLRMDRSLMLTMLLVMLKDLLNKTCRDDFVQWGISSTHQKQKKSDSWWLVFLLSHVGRGELLTVMSHKGT